MKCQVCGVENELKKCSGCYMVAYCCVEHQKQDWPNHKKSCSPIRIVEVETGQGTKIRNAIATRDLRQGEIILEEDPLFHVPYPHCCRPFLPDRQCLACGLVIDEEKKCSTCSLPICCQECEQLPVHKDNECAVFSSGDENNKKISSLVFEHHDGGDADCPIKQIVLIRIAQMKKNQPENWVEVKRLGGVEVTSGEQESESDLLEKDYKMLQNLMKCKGFHHMDFNRGVADRPNDEETTGFAKTASLYRIGSNLHHACFPNCLQSFLPSPFFKIRVRAAIPVKKGEILTVFRLQHHAVGLKGTAFRRPVILRRFNFICDCKQCNDATELGSYFSAVACTKCRDDNDDDENPNNEEKKETEEKEIDGKENLGYLLPVDCSPASFAAVMAGGEEPDWICNQCKDLRPGKEIMDMIRELNETVEYNLSVPGNIGERSEEFRVKFLQDYPKKVLHPQHFLLAGVIHKSMMLYKMLGESVKFIRGAKYHLKIDDHLCPGLSPHRAGMERHIAQELLNMLAEYRFDRSASPKKVEKLLAALKECDEYQLKAIAFYKHHPAERDSETEYYDVKKDLMEERAELKIVEKRIKRMYNIPI